MCILEQEAIYSYCSDLVQRGSYLLVKLWGTKSFQIPESMISPFMRFVRLPDLVKYSEVTADHCTTNRVSFVILFAYNLYLR